MTEPIMIEPDGPNRPAFAAWGLAQDPPLQTATASGWLVPLDLYPSIPAALLDRAYVDGFMLTRPEVPPPISEPEVPSEPPIRKRPTRTRKAVKE